MKRSALLLPLLLLTLILAHRPALAQDSATQEVRSESGDLAITLQLPATWAAEAAPLIDDYPALIFAPDAAMIDMQALQGSEPPVFSGSQVMFIATLTDSDSFSGFDTSGGVETMIASWSEGFGSSLGQPSPVALAEVGGQPAARVTIDADTLSLTLMLVEAAENRRGEAQYMLYFLFTAPGAASEYTDRLLTIAASVQVVENGLPRLGVAAEAAAQAAPVVTGESFAALLAALPVPSDLPFDDDGLLNTVLYLDLVALGGSSMEAIDPYGLIIEDLALAEQRDMQATIGVGLSAIDRIMVYGTPPLRMTLLEGEFDAAAVDAALTSAVGLIRTDQTAYAEYCSPDGCDQGFRSDPRAQQPGNPFGGNIGRREVFALLSNADGPDYLIVSPSVDLVQTAVDRLLSGAAPSVPFVAGLLADSRPLLAAAIFDGTLIGDGVNALAISVAPDAPTVTTVALTLADAAAANANAAGLADRLTRQSVRSERTFADLFASLNVTVGDATVNGETVTITLTGAETGRTAFVVITGTVARDDLGWLLD